MNESTKYDFKYVEVYDTDLRRLVEKSLDPELLATHRVAEIIAIRNDKWLVKLDYDVAKAAGMKPKA
jgi:hypothetical protein